MDPSERFARLNASGALHWGSDFLFEPAAGGSQPVRMVFDRHGIEVDPETLQPVVSTNPQAVIELSELGAYGQPVKGDRFTKVVDGVPDPAQRFEVHSAPAVEGTGTLRMHLRLVTP